MAKAPANPFAEFEEVEPVDPDVAKRASVAHLIPVIKRIAETGKVVRFTLPSEGLNSEIEKLRLAARLEGHTLRTVSRVAQDDGTTKLEVKLGHLVVRRTAAQIAEDEASTEAAPAS